MRAVGHDGRQTIMRTVSNVVPLASRAADAASKRRNRPARADRPRRRTTSRHSSRDGCRCRPVRDAVRIRSTPGSHRSTSARSPLLRTRARPGIRSCSLSTRAACLPHEADREASFSVYVTGITPTTELAISFPMLVSDRTRHVVTVCRTESISVRTARSVVTGSTPAFSSDMARLALRVIDRRIREGFHVISRFDWITASSGNPLPDKEFRYLRTVIVTAAVYRGLDSKLRPKTNLSS